MSDEPPKAPTQPVTSNAPIDAGIVAWRAQLEGEIGRTPGVEMIGSAGGTVHFRFRGQSFIVTIQRTS